MSSYWNKRASYMDGLANDASSSIVEVQAKLYRGLVGAIAKEVEAFIGRYAMNGGLGVSEAKKHLSPSELRGFKDELRGWIALVKDLKGASHEVTRAYLDTYLNRLIKLAARVKVSRLEALMESIREHAIEIGVEQDDLFFSKMEPSVNEAYDYVSYDLDIEQGFSNGLNPIQLDLLFKQRWMDGSFSSRIWKDKDTLLKHLNTTLLQGIALGHSPRRIARDLESRVGSSRVACERVARTEVLHFFNEATYKAYKEHGVEQYRFVASLDERTCPICGGLDGRIFKLSERQEGINYPTMHPNCRCTTIAYSPIYEGVGEKGTRVARSKEGGLYEVPSDMTYEEWKRRFVK